MKTGSESYKYHMVVEELKDNILSGRYAPGEPFPSVKMISRRFKVSHLTAVKALDIFSKAGIPLLLLDFDIGFASNRLRHDFVGVDNREVGEMAGRHLLECGVKSVAFVAWSEMCCNVEQRLEGLLSSFAGKRGVRFAGRYCIMGDGAAMAKKWKTHLPDAIVCASDLVAAHVLKLLLKIGKSCPKKDQILHTVLDI